MKVVLFMDIDGVLHPEPCLKEWAFCCRDLLQDVLREFTSCIEIVISSNWRNSYSLDELRAFFDDDIGNLIVGVTPNIKDSIRDWHPRRTPRHHREWEIETWLQVNRPLGTPWLALDDRSYWFSRDNPNLLLTQTDQGFLEMHQEPLRRMLKERMADCGGASL